MSVDEESCVSVLRSAGVECVGLSVVIGFSTLSVCVSVSPAPGSQSSGGSQRLAP